MSLLPCAAHGSRQPGPIAHVYWFMPQLDQTVLRKRQRLCQECLQNYVISLLTPEDAEFLTCPACGISTEQDVSPVYVTYYEPKMPGQKGAMAFCASCAIEARNRASHNAEDLPDRYLDQGDMVTFPAAPAKVVFADLGRADPGLKHGAPAKPFPPVSGSTS